MGQEVAGEENFQAAKTPTLREFLPFPEGWGLYRKNYRPNTCGLITRIQAEWDGEEHEHRKVWEMRNLKQGAWR